MIDGPVTVVHVLVPEPPGERGGADRHVLDLASWQCSSGLRAVVVERGSPEYAHAARAAGLDVISASGRGRLKSIQMLIAAIDKLRPAVVHAHGCSADYWLAIARLVHAAPIRGRMVLTQHGIVEPPGIERRLVQMLCAREWQTGSSSAPKGS